MISNTKVVLQHASRLSVIVGFISICLRKSIILQNDPSSFRAWVALLILNLVWLKQEISLIMKRAKLPPGNIGYPLVGELPFFATKPLQLYDQKVKTYGKTFSLSIHEHVVSLGDHDDINWIWNTERKRDADSDWPPVIKQLLGPHAFSHQNGKRQKKLKNLVSPAFTPMATRSYVEKIDGVVQSLFASWSGEFHPSTKFKAFALRLFLTTAFGDIEDETFVTFHDDMKIWLDGFMSPFPLKIPGTTFYKAMKARERIMKTMTHLINKFREKNPEGSDRASNTMMGRICYGLDENGNRLSEDELRDNVFLLIFSAHDTTHMSMASALYHLFHQSAVREEIKKEVEKLTRKDELDFDELKSAPVLTAFLAEMWRMDFPVGGSFRKILKDIVYKGRKYAKGTLFLYNCYVALRDTNVYPEPCQFEIQRYLPDDHPLVQDPKYSRAAKDVQYTSMRGNYPVFGGSNHSCMGMHLATLEMKIALVRLLQLYDLEVRNEEKVEFPMNGWKHEFKLCPR